MARSGRASRMGFQLSRRIRPEASHALARPAPPAPLRDTPSPHRRARALPAPLREPSVRDRVPRGRGNDRVLRKAEERRDERLIKRASSARDLHLRTARVGVKLGLMECGRELDAHIRRGIPLRAEFDRVHQEPHSPRRDRAPADPRLLEPRAGQAGEDGRQRPTAAEEVLVECARVR